MPSPPTPPFLQPSPLPFSILHHITTPELLAILGHSSAASLPTGPVIALPFISPFGFTITPALSSKYRYTPSALRQGFDCRTTTAGMTERVWCLLAGLNG